MHQIKAYTVQYEFERPGWDEYMHTEFSQEVVMARSNDEAKSMVQKLHPELLVLRVIILSEEHVHDYFSDDLPDPKGDR